MDTARQSPTPTTPAFPQETSTANSIGFQATARSPISPTSGDRRNGSGDVHSSRGTCAKSPGTVHDRTLATLTGDHYSQPTLYTRRALRRHRGPSQTPVYQAHLYRQFVHLLRPLQPLVSIETGLSHPSFPRNMLQYHLLSHVELDVLAEHYHQSIPSYYSLGYPTSVVGRWWAVGSEGDDLIVRDQHFEALMEEAKVVLQQVDMRNLDGAMSIENERESFIADEKGEKERKAMEIIIEGKRRRFGRFIGLRDCESPGAEDEQVMERAMEAWVWGEIERRMRLEGEWELGMNKGGW